MVVAGNVDPVYAADAYFGDFDPEAGFTLSNDEELNELSYLRFLETWRDPSSPLDRLRQPEPLRHPLGELAQRRVGAIGETDTLQAAFDALQLPVIAVSRRQPDMEAVRTALLDHVPGGQRKWRLIQKAGTVEPAGGVYVQRAGISLSDTETLIERFALNGRLPEPLRTAHLIAGGIAQGESRHRA